MRIAYNESISFIKSNKKYNNVSVDEVLHTLPKILESDKYYSGTDIQRILQAAIASLPEKQKAVFILKYYKEKKYSEIAEITGTSEGGLKASYHIAVKKIKELIKQY